jgi:hypothetical protein
VKKQVSVELPENIRTEIIQCIEPELPVKQSAGADSYTKKLMPKLLSLPMGVMNFNYIIHKIAYPEEDSKKFFLNYFWILQND